MPERTSTGRFSPLHHLHTTTTAASASASSPTTLSSPGCAPAREPRCVSLDQWRLPATLSNRILEGREREPRRESETERERERWGREESEREIDHLNVLGLLVYLENIFYNIQNALYFPFSTSLELKGCGILFFRPPQTA